MADEQSDKRGEARQSFFAKQQLIDMARSSFQQLSAVLRNVTLYPESHPILLTAAERLLGSIEALLVGRKEVAFFFVGGEFFFEKISVPVEEGLSLVIEQITVREVGGIVFKPELSSQELIRFAGLMNKDPAFLDEQGGVSTLIAKEGISHIVLHRVVLVDKQAGADIKSGKKLASGIFKDAVDTVKDMVESVYLGHTSNMRKVNSIVQTMVDNVMEDQDALMGLTSVKMYDEYTFAHSVNTSILCVSLGNFLSFDKPQIAALGAAGLMHDIGKVSVPLEIINKPGKLTDEEWEEIKRHPIEGALLLSDIPGVSKLAMVAAFEHHQHGDVRGYPQVDGELIQHPFSKIVAIADAYEALTAARVYYSVQMPPDNAIRILLKKRGTTFNSVLVKAFVNMIGIFPIGTLLKLDTEETGLVMHQTQDLLRPRVLILTRFDGSEKGAGDEISLLETESGKFKRTVVGYIDPGAAGIDIKKYLE